MEPSKWISRQTLRGADAHFDKWYIQLLGMGFLTLASYAWLDFPVAGFFREMPISHNRFIAFFADVPDRLSVFSVFATLALWALYIFNKGKGVKSRFNFFCRLLAITLPLSYCVKSLSKFTFGRISTRYWLLHPEAAEFKWFHGRSPNNAFPSGHMIVATIFIAAVYCYYPKARILCLSVTVLLAAWLIAFDFHFISDVIAGAYLGLVVHLAVWRRRALLERAS